MDRASGEVVYRCVSPGLALEVRQDARRRWLHFAGDAVQSAMSLRNPAELVLPCLKTMMATLLFQPRPRSVLVLGLGGGALVRSVRHHYPDANIHVVEINAQVIEIAQRFFFVPAPDARLVFEVADVCAFIRTPIPPVDLILLDTIEDEAVPAYLHAAWFHSACSKALGPRGALAMNVAVSDEETLRALLNAMHVGYAGRVLCLPVADYRNVTLIALGRQHEQVTRELLLQRAAALQQFAEIDFAGLVNTLFEINSAHSGVLLT